MRLVRLDKNTVIDADRVVQIKAMERADDQVVITLAGDRVVEVWANGSLDTIVAALQPPASTPAPASALAVAPAPAPRGKAVKVTPRSVTMYSVYEDDKLMLETPDEDQARRYADEMQAV